MKLSTQFLQGDLIAKILNTSTGDLEETYRICRINGVLLVTRELATDSVNVQPLCGRERLTAMQAGLAGKTITWLNGFDPTKDIAVVSTSSEAALAFNINLGVTTSGGSIITTTSYTILKSTTISNEYIESLEGTDLLENNDVGVLLIQNKVMANFISTKGLGSEYGKYRDKAYSAIK